MRSRLFRSLLRSDAPPRLLTPAMGATASTRTPTLTFDSAAACDVEVAQTLTGAPTATGVTGGEYTPSALALSDASYFWRVRRQGGTWSSPRRFYVTPASVGTMFLWIQGLTGAYQDAAGTIPAAAEGDPVGKLTDRSGQGNHLLQTGDTALKPRVVASAVNGLPAVKFDGVDDILTAAHAASLNPNNLHLYIVLNIPSTGAGNFRVFSKSASAYRIYRESGTLKANVADSPDAQISSPPTGAVIVRLKYDKVNIKFKVTGKTEVTAARTASISGTTALTMPDFGFAEWVYGVFGYSAELATDEQTALQTYLTAMTGLAV